VTTDIPQSAIHNREPAIAGESSPPRPLDGLLLLDLTIFLSGPFATQMLGGLGARVIKIEQPGIGDPARVNPPYFGPNGLHGGRPGEGDMSLSALKRNRNKESITLNLKHEEGKAIFRDLVRSADMLVENFAPGVLDRLGLGHEALRELNPRLVVGAISGFGQDGPYRQLPAYDIVVQAMSGMMASTGEPDAPPTKAGPSIADLAAGLYAAIGLLAALQQRARDGLGQVVDVAMLDSLASLVLDEPLDLQVAAGQSPRTGNRRPRLTPFAAYEAADGFIAICAVTDAQVADLFRAMGRPDLIGDARYATLEARVTRASEVDALVEAWTRAHLRADLWRALRAARIPAGPIADIPELLADPQLHHRAMIAPVRHPDHGAVPGAHAANLPIRFSRAEASFDRPAPMLGADNARVYAELLGLTPEQIADLAARGVI
jgi:crotonobetainyl-CoA:carnitine CoA-transferase CaiB-like acyl-CoA transferase